MHRNFKEAPMNTKLVNVQGNEADYGELDSQGEYTAIVSGGEHDNHQVKVLTEKHNCGACGQSVECSCGNYWQSAMNGCWQQGHQRQESGDLSLAQLVQGG